MSCPRGFVLNINGKKYHVQANAVTISGTKDRDYSNNIRMEISVYDENHKLVKLDKDGYPAEKITDFIKNSINGQDSIYWDWDGKNRFLDKKCGKNEEKN